MGEGEAALLVIGLTGGIGSGKSTVARWLAEEGAALVDADQVARDVMRPGLPAWRAVVAAFGPEILGPGGEIDRSALARLSFASPEGLDRLNRATHPHIVEEIRRRLAALSRRGAAVAVVELPLLFEAGLEGLVDEVWVVTAREEVRMARLVARGLSPDDAARRMRAQWPEEARVARADVVLDGEAPLEEARRRVEALYREALSRARAGGAR